MILETVGMDAEAIAVMVPVTDIPDSWDIGWDALMMNASEPNPFYERWFLSAAVAHISEAGACLLAVWQDERLLGLLPLIAKPRYGRLTLKHTQNWTHYHCFYGAPLIQSGREAKFWQAALILLDESPSVGCLLHLVGLDPEGPAFRALASTRRADIVHRATRAMLASPLGSSDYYALKIRKKKRKELARLRARLAEHGAIAITRLAPHANPDRWILDFLQLEASGWKGRQNSALADSPATRSFFEQAIRMGHRNTRCELVRLTTAGRTIAMLVNFITPPGSYAFKIAFDEAFARYSPGVLLQLETLSLLDRGDLDWTDSCAAQDHSMINGLWAERRTIARVTVPLAGRRRAISFGTVRALERLSAHLRRRN